MNDKLDKTFLSQLELLLTTYEIGLMSSTHPRILAEMIQGFIGAYNLAMMHRDKEDGSYVDKRMDSIMDEQKEDLENLKKRKV